MEGKAIEIIVQIVAGLVGGNLGGMLNKAKANPMLNSILGAVGGLIGGQGADMLGLMQGMGLGGDATSSAVVGALLPIIVGFFKK